MAKRILIAQFQRSPEYFIELWKAIHGGDPVPDALRDLASLRLVQALANTLKDSAARQAINGAVQPLIVKNVRTALR